MTSEAPDVPAPGERSRVVAGEERFREELLRLTAELQPQVARLKTEGAGCGKSYSVIEEDLRQYGSSINGWEYDADSSVRYNMGHMIDVLVSKVKGDTARIQNLQLKLGQLVERGP